MHWRDRARTCGLLLILSAASCADEDSKALSGGNPGGDPQSPGDGNGHGGGGANGDGDGDGDGDAPLPPEVEESLSFDTPRAGKTSVYVPNPVTHRVAVVNAQNFAIETLSAGTAPTYVATVPGQDVALVLNVGSRDASLLRTVDGKTQARRVAVGHDANAIAVAPNGKHAVVYFDARASDELASSFQDVTVVSLQEGDSPSRGVSVGFRPREVRFSKDGETAYVITEDGISIIDLTEAVQTPVIARVVPLGDPNATDVQITPDGAFAFARREGLAMLWRVDLSDGSIQSLDLHSLQPLASDLEDAGVVDAGAMPPDASSDAQTDLLPPGALDLTDVDLAPDGGSLLAVVRNRGALLKIPVPGGFDDPSLVEVTFITDQLVGSVSVAPAGNIAVAYTTVSNIEGVVLIPLDTADPPASVRLRKAVRAVALSDDGSRALVLHSAIPQGARQDQEARIDASEGFSLIDINTGFAKLHLTETRIRERDLLVLPDATRLFALERDDARSIRRLNIADLGSFQVSPRELAKPPVAIGLVPGSERVFIGHASEGGMITFFAADSGEVVRAVSGFELASRIPQ